jgi:hypothetical protein
VTRLPIRQTWHNRKETPTRAYPAQILKLRRTQDFPFEIVCIGGYTPICAMPRAALTTAGPSSTGPRQGRPGPTLQTLPGQKRPNRARQTDLVPGRGGPSAGVRARREPEPAVIVVTLVRAGSVRHRKPLVLGGHERSRPA